MFCYSVVKYFEVALLLFGISQSQEIQGRVNLGSDPRSLTSESFLFTLNANSGSLPLYFDLYNVTNGSSVAGEAFDEDVTVSCDITTAFTVGDSDIDVTSTAIPLRNGDTTGSVQFDIVSQGRRVEVQCTGETAIAPPGTTSYFSLDSSAGRTGFVTIKKSPRVSLCSDKIFVANADGVTTGQVTLRLSEPVQKSNVTAKCEVTGVSQVDPTIWLQFDDVRIESNEDSAVVRYHITDRGEILRVTCSAESDDGVQFQTVSSTSEETLFEFESGSVRMLPSTSKVTGDRFTLLLVLSDPVRSGEADVTFFCTLTPLNTTKEAQDIIDDGECVAPDEVGGTTPAPGTTVDFGTAVTSDRNVTPSIATLPPTVSLETTPSLITTPLPATPPITPIMLTPETQTPSFTTDIPPGNDTATWDLTNPQIVFQEGDIHKALEIRLNNPGIGYQGFLLVRCCATVGLNTSPKYSGLSASALATVDVAVARAINWTVAAVSESQPEMAIGNPAYTEVSPCPCDLTSNSCDVNCCCDQVCSEEDHMTFTCLPGIHGGNFTKQDAYSCYNPDIFRPDWSPFLCVETDNSPYLGLYFTTKTGAQDPAAYNTLKATTNTLSLTSFEDSGQRMLDFENPDANMGGYKTGFPVETLFDSNTRGLLSLPQADPNGGCSWLSPIQFQMEASSRCDVDPKQTLCLSSVLSARAFILSTNTGYPPCPEAPGILKSYGGSSPTPTTVRYYCRDDITPYLVSNTTLGQLFPPTGESLFPEDDSSGGTISLPNRCDWDDGYTLPPIPEYEASTYLCSSAVLDVRYEFFWQGSQIVQVDAIVIMGSVALSPLNSSTSTDIHEITIFVTPPPTMAPTTGPSASTMEATVENATGLTTQAQTTLSETTQAQTTGSLTTSWDVTTDAGVMGTGPSMTTDSDSGISQVPNTPLEFTQHFEVKFTHLSTPLTDPTPVEPPQVNDQDVRSGKPGYITGKKVLSGLAVFDPLVECNATGECAPVEPIQPGSFVQIDDAEVNRLRVWVPGLGSLCSQSSLADVTFGEDHISGCILRLGWTQLSNCSTLRDMMMSELQSMVAADRIGKIGNASTTIQDDWAPVFNSYEHVIPTEAPTTTETMTTDFMTTDTEASNETYPRPIDIFQGLCYDIPTGVNLEILYADAGEFGAVIQREIMSAYVTFSTSIIKLQCIGANGFACHLNQTSDETVEWAQSFPITSTVVFTRADNSQQTPVICYFDMCEEEFIFPLTGRFHGDSRQYTLAVAASVILITIAYLAVTKPCL